MNYNRAELLDRLAAEYVLGTLRGGARARFTRLIATLPAAQAAVRAWEVRLGGLAQSLPPVAPPAHVWTAIESRVQPTPGGAPRSPSGWLDWLKPALGLALGIVLGIGIVMLTPSHFVSLDGLAQREQSLPQSYVGLLVNEAGRAKVLASATRHGKRMTVKILDPIDVPDGMRLTLWALPRNADGTALAPFRLGTIPTQGKGEFLMAGTAEQLLSNVKNLGVTLEDASAPSAAPGPFVLTGHCAKLW